MVAVTVAQLPLTVGEREKNLSLAAEAVLAAPRGIVVLPELLNSGYCFRSREESRSLAEPLDGPSVSTLTDVAARTGSTLVTSLALHASSIARAGYTQRPASKRGDAHAHAHAGPNSDSASSSDSASNSNADSDSGSGSGSGSAATATDTDTDTDTDDLVLNVAVVVEADGVVGTYTKAHLWGREAEHFAPGTTGPTLIASQFGRLGVMVCYDLEFPEFTRAAALAGADLIVAPVNWPLEDRPVGERAIEQVVVQAAARQSRVAIAVSDRTGAERLGEDVGSDWVGGSIIVGQDGFPLTETAYGHPALLSAEVDLDASRDKALGPFNDVVRDRRPELY